MADVTGEIDDDEIESRYRGEPARGGPFPWPVLDRIDGPRNHLLADVVRRTLDRVLDGADANRVALCPTPAARGSRVR